MPSAIRHGFYSATTILPGENLAAFDKQHRELIAEFSAEGVCEHDIVLTIARLIWRKQNLETLRKATRAQLRLTQVFDDMLKAKFSSHRANNTSSDEAEKMVLAAEDQVCKEFDDTFVIQFGETASFKRLDEELALEERFGIMIERLIKRLLYVRGLKSMSGAAAPQRIAAPIEPT